MLRNLHGLVLKGTANLLQSVITLLVLQSMGVPSFLGQSLTHVLLLRLVMSG